MTEIGFPDWRQFKKPYDFDKLAWAIPYKYSVRAMSVFNQMGIDSLDALKATTIRSFVRSCGCGKSTAIYLAMKCAFDGFPLKVGMDDNIWPFTKKEVEMLRSMEAGISVK